MTPGLVTSGYKLEPDPDEPNRVLQVQLDRKTTGPVEVVLSTQQDGDFAQSDDWLNLAGLEILDAVQQSGHIAVCIVGDWQLVWGRAAVCARSTTCPNRCDAKTWRRVLNTFIVPARPPRCRPASCVARLRIRRRSELSDAR